MTGFDDLYLKIPLILPISIFMHNLSFEHEKCFLTLDPARDRSARDRSVKFFNLNTISYS